MKIKNLSPQTVKITRSDDGKSTTVAGYAAVYNSDSKPLPVNGKVVIERILSGAFDEVVSSMSVQRKDCVATVNHDRTEPMARSSSGTLNLESDDVGLKFSYQIPDTTAGKDLSIKLERGDLKNCSFVGFAKVDDVKLYRGDDGVYRQDISKIHILHDVSIVVDSQYETPSVNEISRSIQDFEDAEKTESEKITRNLEQEIAKKESQKNNLNNLITRAEL